MCVRYSHGNVGHVIMWGNNSCYYCWELIPNWDCDGGVALSDYFTSILTLEGDTNQPAAWPYSDFGLPQNLSNFWFHLFTHIRILFVKSALEYLSPSLVYLWQTLRNRTLTNIKIMSIRFCSSWRQHLWFLVSWLGSSVGWLLGSSLVTSNQ